MIRLERWEAFTAAVVADVSGNTPLNVDSEASRKIAKYAAHMACRLQKVHPQLPRKKAVERNTGTKTTR